MKQVTVIGGLVAAALLIGPRAGLAQTATVYGQLGNFDVVNNTGQDAHGFEIELQGLSPADVLYTFSIQRYGAPVILPSPLGTYVRWTTPYNVGAQAYDQTTIAHPSNTPFAGTCYQWSGPAYATAGCEHFGVSLAVGSPKATYRWLVDDPAQPGTLIAVDPPEAVAQPYYYVAPVVPAAAPAPPVVVVEVQAPEPAETPEVYGDAQWMKVFVTQLTREVGLDELVSDNPLVVPMDPAQAEVNWEIVQTEPVNNHGRRGRQRTQNQGGIAPTTRSVVRRFEMYDYTGAYDPITHEALCADLTCSTPGDGELGDFVSAQMTAVNVQADWLAVNLVGSGKIDSSDKVIACGSKCGSPYIGGTQVTLTALAASGSVFTAWTGACSAFGATPTCTVTVRGHVEATATFSPKPTSGGGGGGGGGGTTTPSFTLSVGIANKGVVTSNPVGLNCGGGGNCSMKAAQGAVVTLTATPPVGLAFVNWGGACSGTSPSCTVTLTKDTQVQASFSK